jgi:hypothetical protein
LRRKYPFTRSLIPRTNSAGAPSGAGQIPFVSYGNDHDGLGGISAQRGKSAVEQRPNLLELIRDFATVFFATGR